MIIAKIITTEARGFEDIVADIGIEFRLATKDPDGNCTTGVTYNQSALTFNGGENVKDDTYWDNDRYLNIWTVANVASGAAAYAYYPGSAPANHEGILCQHDYFGTTGTSSNGNWRRHTMSHEAGHYFNLAHPWGSTNEVVLNLAAPRAVQMKSSRSPVGKGSRCSCSAEARLLTMKCCCSGRPVGRAIWSPSVAWRSVGGTKSRPSGVWRPFRRPKWSPV